MSELLTVSDIRKKALDHSGEKIDGTSEFDSLCIDAINKWHRDVLKGSTELDPDLGDPWTWARSEFPGVINLEIPFESTLTIAKDSLTGAFTTAPTISLKNYTFRVTDTNEFYRIKAHLANATSFTISGAYTGDSVTNAPFTGYKLDYTLSNVLRLVAPMRVFRSQRYYGENCGQIEQIDQSIMDHDYPLFRLKKGTPDKFAHNFPVDDGNIVKQKVRFNMTPGSERIRVEYDYIPVPDTLTNTSIPLIPLEHRSVLVFGAAYSILLDKQDDRLAEYRELTKAALQAMTKAYRRTKGQGNRNFGKLIARRDRYSSPRNYPYDTEVDTI